jgi:hypothetical protein
MNKRILLLSIFLIFLLSNFFVTGNISEFDKQVLETKTQQFIDKINDNDVNGVNSYFIQEKNIISSDWINQLTVMDYKIVDYSEANNTVVVIIDAVIKTNSGFNENMDLEIVYKKVNDEWKVLSTDIFSILFVEQMLTGIGKFFGYGMAILFIIWFLFFVIGLVMFIIWIIMLIDLSKREFPDSNTKIIWILIMVLCGGIGAIIYYFMVKRKDN